MKHIWDLIITSSGTILGDNRSPQNDHVQNETTNNQGIVHFL